MYLNPSGAWFTEKILILFVILRRTGNLEEGEQTGCIFFV